MVEIGGSAGNVRLRIVAQRISEDVDITLSATRYVFVSDNTDMEFEILVRWNTPEYAMMQRMVSEFLSQAMRPTND